MNIRNYIFAFMVCSSVTKSYGMELQRNWFKSERDCDKVPQVQEELSLSRMCLEHGALGFTQGLAAQWLFNPESNGAELPGPMVLPGMALLPATYVALQKIRGYNAEEPTKILPNDSRRLITAYAHAGGFAAGVGFLALWRYCAQQALLEGNAKE